MSLHQSGGILGGVGLAASRVALGPATLVTTASDHVALRTPSRPDHRPGNALHLLRPPRQLSPWLERFDATVGSLGASTRRVRWELPDRSRPDIPDLPDGVHLEVADVLAYEPRDDTADMAEDAEVVVASDDRHWAGAKVLYLHAGWDGAEPYWRWWVDQQRQLVSGGRGAVLVAYRYGVPAGRVGIFHDRAGLAVVSDLVIHPLHRRQGLGAALLRFAVRHHLDQHPADRVVSVVTTPSRLWADVGFRPVGAVMTAGD